MTFRFAQTQSQLRNDGIDSISSPYFLSLIKAPVFNPYQFNNNGQLSARLSNVDELRVGNPLSIIENGIGTSKQYGLNTSIRPEFNIVKDKLNAGMLFSYTWNKLDENSFTPDKGVTDQVLLNSQNEIYAIALNKVQDRMDTHNSLVIDGFLHWNILKNSVNYLNITGGYRYYSDTYNSRYAMGYNTGSDNMTQLANTTSSLRYASGLDNEWKSMSYYFNADYSLKTRYLLNVSMAMDASSRFGRMAGNAVKVADFSWGAFPSITGGWVISSERFMKSIKVVNYLKLSAGYDISGNDNIPDFAHPYLFQFDKILR